VARRQVHIRDRRAGAVSQRCYRRIGIETDRVRALGTTWNIENQGAQITAEPQVRGALAGVGDTLPLGIG